MQMVTEPLFPLSLLSPIFWRIASGRLLFFVHLLHDIYRSWQRIGRILFFVSSFLHSTYIDHGRIPFFFVSSFIACDLCRSWQITQSPPLRFLLRSPSRCGFLAPLSARNGRIHYDETKTNRCCLPFPPTNDPPISDRRDPSRARVRTRRTYPAPGAAR